MDDSIDKAQPRFLFVMVVVVLLVTSCETSPQSLSSSITPTNTIAYTQAPTITLTPTPEILSVSPKEAIELAKRLICQPCIEEQYRGNSNSVWIESISTGIFKYVDLIDNQTGEKKGRFLVLQMVSRDNDGEPMTYWMVVQAQEILPSGNYSEQNMFRFVASGHFIDQGMDKDDDQGRVFPIETWQEWMPRGSRWAYGFPKGKPIIVEFREGTNFDTSYYYDLISSFIASLGETIGEEVILIPNTRHSPQPSR